MSHLYYARGISLIANGIQAGIGPCMNLVSVPAIKAGSDPLPVFAATYNNGKKLAISSILVSSAAHFYIYYKTGATPSLVCGLVSFVSFPYTVLFMKPVNDKLFALMDSPKDDKQTDQLIEKWNSLQWFRTLAGISALVLNVFY